MTPDDLAQTHAAAFPDGQRWDAATFQSLLNGNGMILCGDPRSFILGRLTLDEVEVLTLATSPADQRQGHATRTFLAFETAARQRGATEMFLEVASDNEPAKRLYQNMNFAPVGQRPNYYKRPDGRRVDAIILRKLLK